MNYLKLLILTFLFYSSISMAQSDGGISLKIIHLSTYYGPDFGLTQNGISVNPIKTAEAVGDPQGSTGTYIDDAWGDFDPNPQIPSEGFTTICQYNLVILNSQDDYAKVMYAALLAAQSSGHFVLLRVSHQPGDAYCEITGVQRSFRTTPLAPMVGITNPI